MNLTAGQRRAQYRVVHCRGDTNPAYYLRKHKHFPDGTEWQDFDAPEAASIHTQKNTHANLRTRKLANTCYAHTLTYAGPYNQCTGRQRAELRAQSFLDGWL